MRIEDVFGRFFSQVVDYLPNLAAGLLLVIVGAGAAWFVKRITVQICVILRLHRLLQVFRWARGLNKVDVRLSLYGLLGNLVGLVVFLVFLNAAFSTLRLTVVSALVERLVLIIPRLLIALSIFGIGWLISLWAGMGVRRALLREGVPRASLVAGYASVMLLLLFAGMALAELDVSREVVIIGFGVVYVTMGAITVIVTAVAGKEILRKVLESSRDERT